MNNIEEEIIIYLYIQNPIIIKCLKILVFIKIQEVSNKVLLLENDPNGINSFLDRIQKKRVEGEIISSVVVNCNPFTLGT